MIRDIREMNVTNKFNIEHFIAEKIFADIEQWLAVDGDIRMITAKKFEELKNKYAEDGE